MTEVLASLTEIRADGKQKWERGDLSKNDHMRYIWLDPFYSVPNVKVGATAKLVFNKGPGGSWALWKVKELVA